MMEQASYPRIVEALSEIAKLLRHEQYESQARDIERLSEDAQAIDPMIRERFRAEITSNKWYWLGMGTIADICFTNRQLHGRFVRAYYDLALACELEGCASIYSEDVKQIFGRWIRDGVL